MVEPFPDHLLPTYTQNQTFPQWDTRCSINSANKILMISAFLFENKETLEIAAAARFITAFKFSAAQCNCFLYQLCWNKTSKVKISSYKKFNPATSVGAIDLY